MSEIPKAYEPSAVEEKWYRFWMDEQCFVADPASKKPAYSIVIPPPNVTGMLHMGHVLNNTIQDILSRKARMDGKEVLWLPGTDHAGIATQVQVEKQLWKEEKKTRNDLGREEFLKRVWAWKEKHGSIIIEQLKKLGSSCDWSRERFTMDPEYSACVQKVFFELYRKEHIYRGKRMVNWCPVSQTALSDEEVEMKSQKGFMYYFRVEIAETPGTWLTIATTRPETIPGDTAIAVNPNDPRYAGLVGKHVLRPLPAESPREKKLIPIISDDQVDFEFGTGVLKVTPAHDKADFDIMERWNSAQMGYNPDEHPHVYIRDVEVISSDGTMNDLAGNELMGLDRFAAREVAVKKLREIGSLIEEKPYENNVGFSQRAGVPIEPRLSEQWFLKYPSIKQSFACVEQSEGTKPDVGQSEALSVKRDDFAALRFHPDRWAKVYTHWMTNIRDWCISRQLWWGHRVPVWKAPNDLNDALREQAFELAASAQKEFPLSVFIGNTESWLSRQKSGGGNIHSVEKVICLAPGMEGLASRLENLGFEQDPDVLDTWFSSWLWPFATMGWPEKTPTLQRFYPTTDLVTGPDIIFFWVARMIMAGYEFMGDLPFRNVYFTGIIRDKQGRKMSKTLGNSPDPLDLIGKYGADALRFGTMRGAPLGQDVLFDEKDVELGRNFCNKLWNACRFRQMQGGESEGEIEPSLLTSDDKWILLKLDLAIREVSGALEGYKFNEAAQTLYRFFWSEFCDWYLETTKAALNGANAALKANTLAVIDFILSNTLRLFHPFLPFITEELWHGLGFHQDLPNGQGGRTIMFANWPKPFDTDFRDHYSLDDCYLESVSEKYELVVQGRNLRREGNIPSSKKVRFVFKPVDPVVPHQAEVLKLLLNAESLDVNPNYRAPKGTPAARSKLGELFLPLEGLIDPVAEKSRLSKEVEKIRGEIEKVQQKLANPAFVQKVPPAVLEEHQKRLADWQGKLSQTEASLANLG
jgi:valyl-tRNA synthetase